MKRMIHFLLFFAALLSFSMIIFPVVLVLPDFIHAGVIIQSLLPLFSLLLLFVIPLHRIWAYQRRRNHSKQKASHDISRHISSTSSATF